MLTQWVDAAEREKASRSRFRQATLRPDEVEATLNDVRRSLGGPADAERFMRDALGLLSGQLSDTADGFTVRTDTLPRAVLDQLPATKTAELRFHRSLPAPVGEPLLTRTDPTVEATARYVLDAALDPLLPSCRKTGPPGRCHPHDGRAHRHHAARGALPRRTRRARLAANHHPGRRRCPVPRLHQQRRPADLARLRRHRRTADGPADRETSTTNSPQRSCSAALDRLPALQEHLTAIGEQHRADAIEAHRAVRRTSRIGLRGLDARLLPPPDVLGVYIYLPDQGTS